MTEPNPDTPRAADPVKLSDIPLPPDAVMAQVLAEEDGETHQPVDRSADKRDAKAAAEIAELDFDQPDAFTVVVPITHTFRWDGKRVESIPLQRLSTGAVGALLDRLDGGERLMLTDIYAEMSGLPAAVLRGLKDVDGEEVSRKARPFFAPRLRGDAGRIGCRNDGYGNADHHRFLTGWRVCATRVCAATATPWDIVMALPFDEMLRRWEAACACERQTGRLMRGEE